MDRPRKCISVEKARELQDNWKRTRGKEIERILGYGDTREFWYSIEELQEYLDYVKEKSKEQGIKNPGVRIYLGAYKETERKKSYSTLFLAPTKEKNENSREAEAKVVSNSNNYDIDSLNETQGGWPPTDY